MHFATASLFPLRMQRHFKHEPSFHSDRNYENVIYFFFNLNSKKKQFYIRRESVEWATADARADQFYIQGSRHNCFSVELEKIEQKNHFHECTKINNEGHTTAMSRTTFSLGALNNFCFKRSAIYWLAFLWIAHWLFFFTAAVKTIDSDLHPLF